MCLCVFRLTKMRCRILRGALCCGVCCVSPCGRVSGHYWLLSRGSVCCRIALTAVALQCVALRCVSLTQLADPGACLLCAAKVRDGEGRAAVNGTWGWPGTGALVTALAQRCSAHARTVRCVTKRGNSFCRPSARAVKAGL